MTEEFNYQESKKDFLILIAAWSQCQGKYVIGNDNTIPWRCSSDLKHFKETTLNSIIIYGHNTFLSLNKRPLPLRTNVILTKNNLNNYIQEQETTCNYAYGQTTYFFPTLEDALKMFAKDTRKKFICGGRQIYKEALEKDLINTCIISEMKQEYPGNVYFPNEAIKTDRKWNLDIQDKGDYLLKVYTK